MNDIDPKQPTPKTHWAKNLLAGNFFLLLFFGYFKLLGGGKKFTHQEITNILMLALPVSVLFLLFCIFVRNISSAGVAASMAVIIYALFMHKSK